MNKNLSFVALIALSFVLVGCGKGSSPAGPGPTTPPPVVIVPPAGGYETLGTTHRLMDVNGVYQGMWFRITALSPERGTTIGTQNCFAAQNTCVTMTVEMGQDSDGAMNRTASFRFYFSYDGVSPIGDSFASMGVPPTTTQAFTRGPFFFEGMASPPKYIIASAQKGNSPETMSTSKDNPFLYDYH